MRISLEEKPLKKDHVIEIQDLTFLIHERDEIYFQHAKLDYVKNVFGEGKFELLRV